MVDRLDIVILGATGAIGTQCIPYLHKLTKSNEPNLSWAVAGRSEIKLKQLLVNMGTKLNVDFSDIPIIICNIKNNDSLLKMAERAKLVINCVGPYTVYGERVVDACLETRSHYIDVSSEIYFMEYMELKKNKIAKEKSVYVISGCGFNGLLYDIGILHLRRNFGEDAINSAATVTSFATNRNTSLPIISYDTWVSLVHDASNVKEIQKTRKELFSKKLPTFYPKLKRLKWHRKAPWFFGWVLPFPGANRSVMYRTQRYMYEVENKRPIQIETLLFVKSFFHVLLMYLIALLFFIFSKLEYGRKLLLDFPEIFTFGMISKALPTEETRKEFGYEMIIIGTGWPYALSDIHQNPEEPGKEIAGRINGSDPGYGSNCVCLVLAALTVLNETDKLPANGKGGVYPPGAVFAKTSIIERLKNELYFSVIINDMIFQGY